MLGRILVGPIDERFRNLRGAAVASEQDFDAELWMDAIATSGGQIVLQTGRIGATVYVRWNPDRSTYEWLSVAGPDGTVMMYEPAQRDQIIEKVLSGAPAATATYPHRYDESPFAEVPAVPGEYEKRSYTLWGDDDG